MHHECPDQYIIAFEMVPNIFLRVKVRGVALNGLGSSLELLEKIIQSSVAFFKHLHKVDDGLGGGR